jgi:hypothetical protein
LEGGPRVAFKGTKEETIIIMEVSSTFGGSPVTLDSHFKIENNVIEDLNIV